MCDCVYTFFFFFTCIAAVPCWGMFTMFKCKAMGKGTCFSNQKQKVHIK